jgi:hypothetical protein
MSSLHFGGNNQHNPYGQGGMTESPKPLSPGHPEQHRLNAHDGSMPDPRSPNMTQQMHQQNFGRRLGSESSHMDVAPAHHPNSAHQLPPIAGGHPMVPRQQTHQQMPAPGAEPQPGALPNMAHFYALEERMRRSEEQRHREQEEHQREMRALKEKVAALEAQLTQEQARKAASVVSQQEAQVQQNLQQQRAQGQ